MRQGFKIVIVGPPHSGKSRFTKSLLDILNEDISLRIDSTPDGQLHNSTPKGLTNAESIRKRSNFTKQKVEKVLHDINVYTDKIIIVDTGGKESTENDEYFRNCTHAIVLCNDKIKDKNNNRKFWEKYCKKHGLKIIASLNSSLEGQDTLKQKTLSSIDKTIVGTITHLDDEKETTEELKAIAKRIEDISVEYGINKETSSFQAKYAENEYVIDMREIAYSLGYEVSENGKIDWKKEDLKHILGRFENKLYNDFSQLKNEVKISKAEPYWLRFALVQRAKDLGVNNIQIYDKTSDTFKRIQPNFDFNNRKCTYPLDNVERYEIIPNKASMFLYNFGDSTYAFLNSNDLVEITQKDYEDMCLPFISPRNKLFFHCPENHCDEYLAQSINISYVNRDKYFFDTSSDNFNYVKIQSIQAVDLGKVIPVEKSTPTNIISKLSTQVYSPEQKEYGNPHESIYETIEEKKNDRNTYRKGLSYKFQDRNPSNREKNDLKNITKSDRY